MRLLDVFLVTSFVLLYNYMSLSKNLNTNQMKVTQKEKQVLGLIFLNIWEMSTDYSGRYAEH